MKNFKNLEIWTNGIEIVKSIYVLSAQLPESEKFGLKSQITRAAVSIPSNISEGCSGKSDKEFVRYLKISLGSLYELETQLIIMKELNFIKENNLLEIFDLVNKEQRMIISLICVIKKRF